MAVNYVFLAVAQQEYEEAILWYLEKSSNAAKGFIQEVEKTLRLICNHPERWRNEFKDFYELGLKKYPYSIIYLIHPDHVTVVVTGVFHQKRNPSEKYHNL